MAVTLSLTVSESNVSIANNTSKITVVVKVTSTGSLYNNSAKSGYVTIDGEKFTFSHAFAAGTTTTLATKSKTVTHNSDGTKSVAINASYTTGVSVGTITASQTYTCTTINRTYTINYYPNGGSGAPSSQTKTYGVDLTLSSTVPTRSGYSFLGWSENSIATTATYTAGGTYSTNASADLYAVWSAEDRITVKCYDTQSAYYNYYAYAGYSFTFPTFTKSGYTLNGWATTYGGSVSYTAGQTVTWTSSMPTSFYAVWTQNTPSSGNLQFTSVSAIRGNSTYVTFTAYFSGATGSQTLYLYTKTSSASSYTLKQTWSLSSSATSQTASLSGYATDTNYDVMWYITDGSSNATTYDIISNSSYIWKSDGDDLDIGATLKANNSLDVLGSLTLNGTAITAGGSIPVGTVVMYGGASAPDGWLMCNGARYYASDYPSLYAVIGTAFGSVGSGTFRVPDFDYRFPFGAGDNVDLGETGGESQVELTVANIPAHTHTITTDGAHTHKYGYYTDRAANGSARNTPGSPTGGDATYNTSSDGGHSHTIGSTGAASGYAVHNNIPPYTGIYFIIKY